LRVPSSCPKEAVSRVFKLGAAFSGPLVYQTAGAACAPVSAADLWGRDLYAVGDEVAPSAFVAGTEQIAP
jgi:hypothetical protein